jgi:hypothetical protein
MAYKSLGHDAPRKGDKELVWGETKYPKSVVTMLDYDLFEKLQAYCESRRISMSQMLRFLIADTVLKDD